MSERADRCETCRYWDVWDDPVSATGSSFQFGECRRHAPRPYLESDDPTLIEPVTWPNTRMTSWCGEWKPQSPTGNVNFPFGQLSVRARNVLKTSFPEVATIDDLLAVGRYRLSLTRNCGVTTLMEFDDIAKEAGVLDRWRKS